MSTHKHIERICVVITVLSLLLTVLFINGEALGITASSRSMGYESTLFDTSRVHSIDIVIDDWDAFLETATSEEYTTCSVVIDNEAVKNVAIRGKGNTSLSTVSTMGSERYSFKIEFDHYETGKTYKGLDKLCLNNLIQDNTYMKDYLAYRLMAAFGVDTPLCSFVYVTVNGEDWGLYLAVEAVEDSFMERVYNGEGDLYKPDSLSMGGGPGNGMDFNIEDFISENADAMGFPFSRSADSESGSDSAEQTESGPLSDFSLGDASTPPSPPDGMEMPDMSGMPDIGGGMPGGMGMGSSDVKLQYSDDDPESYTNIFDNAKSTVTDADKSRLIRTLKSLSEGEDLEEVLDIDEVLRYFVVHNYLVNSDSYTGSMVHNYYLHEADGQLSMIPWDYNLAFGTFQAGDATDAVNDPIDSPLSVSGDGTRPMADWIFQNEEYTELYHQYFAEFLDSVDIVAIIDEAYALIASYVEKDPTAFCTYEEFETGVATLRSFCEKRSESVLGQLDGTIPSTDKGQEADSSTLIDASDLTLSDMGSMNAGGGSFGGPGERSDDDTQPQHGFSFPGSGGEDSFSPPSFGQGDEQSGGFSTPDFGEGGPSGFGETPQGGSFGGFSPNGDMSFTPQTQSATVSWPTLILCAVVFAAGFLIVILHRKRS